MSFSTLNTKQACMLLNSLPGLGPVSVQKLLQAFGNDPIRIFGAKRWDLEQVPYIKSSAVDAIIDPLSFFDLKKEENHLCAIGAKFLHIGHDHYPELLAHIASPPTGLYVLGPHRLGPKTIAIVGSRRASLYGLSVAKKLAMALAEQGFCIVSGLARGIDTAAHEGALAVGGKTVAVLGCGVDVIYPPENKSLYYSIQEKGAIMSEFCIGKRGDRYTFPMRNRIISGLSQAVVVVETSENGGSMITARLAGEQGRHVFAVPGQIYQTSSSGCHTLIREGATLIRGISDIAEELAHLSQLSFNFTEKASAFVPPTDLNESELLIIKVLKELGPSSIDTVSLTTQLLPHQISSSLLLLELKGLVAKKIDGLFESRC